MFLFLGRAIALRVSPIISSSQDAHNRIMRGAKLREKGKKPRKKDQKTACYDPA